MTEKTSKTQKKREEKAKWRCHPLDFEDPAQRDGFRLRVRVSDGLHDATSNIVVQLVDENDHAPDIIGPAEVRIFEDVPRNTVVARYNVSDRDANDHAR
ncbi:hypothetical protein ANCDUO_13190 [Ancylostoma duodenale]|uniref:Cadherin domain-containing protein n=1 Tax=Ancylostoma duodenale TaxID=51022 RepID=A0A0C2GCL9_9BILA|nr:hypothetical protein ANCDUO_13190 [Ancylostoma duodenale]